MARTTYRSLVPINTPARKEAAYQRAADLLHHALVFGVDVLRIEYMSGTQRIEVDLSDPIATAQATHLGIEVSP